MSIPALIGFVVGAGMALAVWAVLARRRRVVTRALEADLIAIEEGRPIRAIAPTGVGGALGRLVRRAHEVLPRLARQMAEQERDHQQLRAVLSGMAEGVLAIDARKRLLFANPAAARLFGLKADSLGRPLAELVRSLPIQEAIEAPLNGSGAYRREVVLPARGPSETASERVLALRGSPLPGATPTGAILVVHDVTDLRRLERMRQDFVANASHELKTPLASIKAYTESLIEWALEDPEHNVKFLEQIDEQADRLNLLVQDLLSLARLESGQPIFDHQPMVLGPVARRIAESHRDRAEAKGLRYEVALGVLGEEIVVRADEEAIRQLLDNLIDNAIKYTPEGGQVRVSARRGEGQVALEVADTGVGIPRDDLARIFERFYRVDKARSRELGGTGLGLSIVKHLVQSLGGSVGVTTRLGSGSRFTVGLPLYTTPKAGTAAGKRKRRP